MDQFMKYYYLWTYKGEIIVYRPVKVTYRTVVSINQAIYVKWDITDFWYCCPVILHACNSWWFFSFCFYIQRSDITVRWTESIKYRAAVSWGYYRSKRWNNIQWGIWTSHCWPLCQPWRLENPQLSRALVTTITRYFNIVEIQTLPVPPLSGRKRCHICS